MINPITTTRTIGIYTSTNYGPWTSRELPIPEGTVRLINGSLYSSKNHRWAFFGNWEMPELDKHGKPKPVLPKPVLIEWWPIQQQRRWFGGPK